MECLVALGTVDTDGAAIHIGAVKGIDRGVNLLVGVQRHEAEATRPVHRQKNTSGQLIALRVGGGGDRDNRALGHH